MKFIVDAQLPKSLSDLLRFYGHDSIHTIELQKGNATKDSTVTEISLLEKRVVISKDHDFLESLLLKKQPEKLIMVKTGNISNTVLLNIFRQHLSHLLILLENSSLIEIYRTEIVAHT